jgi:Gas vesicle synthesis protein GvpL/GvpF
VTEPGGALYVYGVLAAAEREGLSVAGVEGAAVRTVESNGLAALVSPVQSDVLSAAREIRAHWGVLQSACETATVLPVRFGTVLANEEAVRRQILDPNADHLRELLEQLAGCIQLTVKGEYDEDAILREVVRSSRQIATLRARVRSMPPDAGYYDRIRLGELVADQVERYRESDTQRVLEALGSSAVASHVEQVSTADAAFNLSFLVQRAKERAFSTRLGTIAEEFGDRIRIHYLGPLPPYSFTEGQLEAGAV